MYLVESKQTQNSTELYVFSRDSDGKKSVEIVRDFRPYFYVLENAVVPDDYRIVSVETGYKSIDGKQLKKVYTNKSNVVADVRSLFDIYYEADVIFAQRYIIDVLGEQEIVPLKTFYFDIETDYTEYAPDTDTYDMPITSIACTDDFTNEEKAFIWIPEDGTTIDHPDNNVIICKDEEDMIRRFISHYIRNDPDIISGWNIEGFDLPYLIPSNR